MSGTWLIMVSAYSPRSLPNATAVAKVEEPAAMSRARYWTDAPDEPKKQPKRGPLEIEVIFPQAGRLVTVMVINGV